MCLQPLPILYQPCCYKCGHRFDRPVGSNSHCVEAANAQDTETLAIRHLFGWWIVCHPQAKCIWLKLIYPSVCIASLIRIYYITFLRTEDLTWIVGEVFIWSSIEPCIGILCACLPTLHPLFRSIVSRMFRSRMGRYVQASRKQEAANKRTLVRRPRPLDWDETLLTTHNIQVEMSGIRRDHADDGQITVDMDFRIVEESNQLK